MCVCVCVYIYIYLRTELRQVLIHISSVSNDALHDLTLITLTVARFIGHTQETSPIEEVLRLFFIKHFL